MCGGIALKTRVRFLKSVVTFGESHDGRLSKLDSNEVVHNQGAITTESPLDSYSVGITHILSMS